MKKKKINYFFCNSHHVKIFTKREIKKKYAEEVTFFSYNQIFQGPFEGPIFISLLDRRLYADKQRNYWFFFWKKILNLYRIHMSLFVFQNGGHCESVMIKYCFYVNYTDSERQFG